MEMGCGPDAPLRAGSGVRPSMLRAGGPPSPLGRLSWNFDCFFEGGGRILGPTANEEGGGCSRAPPEFIWAMHKSSVPVVGLGRASGHIAPSAAS